MRSTSQRETEIERNSSVSTNAGTPNGRRRKPSAIGAWVRSSPPTRLFTVVRSGLGVCELSRGVSTVVTPVARQDVSHVGLPVIRRHNVIPSYRLGGVLLLRVPTGCRREDPRGPSANTNTFARESHLDILAAKADGTRPRHGLLNP
jgi:hypothetical protein